MKTAIIQFFIDIQFIVQIICEKVNVELFANVYRLEFFSQKSNSKCKNLTSEIVIFQPQRSLVSQQSFHIYINMQMDTSISKKFH